MQGTVAIGERRLHAGNVLIVSPSNAMIATAVGQVVCMCLQREDLFGLLRSFSSQRRLSRVSSFGGLAAPSHFRTAVLVPALDHALSPSSAHSPTKSARRSIAACRAVIEQVRAIALPRGA